MISVGCAGAPGPAATPATLAAPIPAVSTAAMDAHLKYLADDLLEGRAPATRGGRLAAKYIAAQFEALGLEPAGDRKSTRLNSSHTVISYAVFCLKKKKEKTTASMHARGE